MMSGMFFHILRILTHISLGLHSLGSAEAKIGIDWKLSKLCQEYFAPKIIKI